MDLKPGDSFAVGIRIVCDHPFFLSLFLFSYLFFLSLYLFLLFEPPPLQLLLLLLRPPEPPLANAGTADKVKMAGARYAVRLMTSLRVIFSDMVTSLFESKVFDTPPQTNYDLS